MGCFGHSVFKCTSRFLSILSFWNKEFVQFQSFHNNYITTCNVCKQNYGFPYDEVWGIRTTGCAEVADMQGSGLRWHFVKVEGLTLQCIFGVPDTYKSYFEREILLSRMVVFLAEFLQFCRLNFYVNIESPGNSLHK